MELFVFFFLILVVLIFALIKLFSDFSESIKSHLDFKINKLQTDNQIIRQDLQRFRDETQQNILHLQKMQENIFTVLQDHQNEITKIQIRVYVLEKQFEESKK